MDDDFFEYLEEEGEDGGPIDIGDFAFYYEVWERENVAR